MVNFLAELFHQGYQYHLLNTYRSVALEKLDGESVGQQCDSVSGDKQINVIFKLVLGDYSWNMTSLKLYSPYFVFYGITCPQNIYLIASGNKVIEKHYYLIDPE